MITPLNELPRCVECARPIEWLEPVPEFGLPGQWMHRRGRWRVPAHHTPVPPPTDA